MTVRQRFVNVMNFKRVDRLPLIEWAHWWDKTHHQWQKEGLSPQLTGEDLFNYFKLDELKCLFIHTKDKGCPGAAYHGAPIIKNKQDYHAIKPYLFTDELIHNAVENAKKLSEGHKSGDFALRIWLDGCFWFPRSLFGIEDHLYAFYDHSELMHGMLRDMVQFNLRAMEAVFDILTPDFVGLAEDMSYNNGSMLSREMFEEFIAPYYTQYMPLIKSRGINILVDTDGDVMPMLPWLTQAGIEGIYPLERQAGVDVAKIREYYPELIMMGAYDKMVMSQGEEAIRNEFERLLPVMKTGGFIPSVDHQTPPEVSLENYKIYRRLYEEYAIKGGKGI